MRIGGQDLIHDGATMPRRIVNGDDDLVPGVSRVRPRNITQMRGEGELEAARFTLSGALYTLGRLFHQPGGQFASDDIQGGITIHHVLVIPRPHRGAMPFDAQRCAEGRGQGKAGFILAQEDTGPGVGFFLNASRSCCAVCCLAGSPRKYRYVGR